MTSNSVNLTGVEHLPGALRAFAGSRCKYSSHLHTVHHTARGTEHTYIIVVAAERLSDDVVSRHMAKAGAPKRSTGHLVSQISSTTTSEKGKPTRRPKAMSPIPMSSVEVLPESVSEEEILPVTSWNTKLSPEEDESSLPDVTYWSPGFGAARAEKLVSMVNVELHLIHEDVLGRRAKATYTDEFSTDSTIRDVMDNFRKMFSYKLRGKEFHPRISYCVGRLSKANSKPLTQKDLKKTISKLAVTTSFDKLVLIANNFD